ncbi:MAG: 1-acyl-sn-glycerol-3-phosphate acyltransferase [Bryobacterales bacterium]|nr:1-acyl-sn-glycerol-3-phosphate acyltransferase [Bryobacterales bacterium]
MGRTTTHGFAGSYAWKPLFQACLRPWVDSLARRGVSPNRITVAALALSLATGLALSAFAERTALYLLLPLVMILRMALNAADGMLAREHNRKSALGLYLNELGDVGSDLFLLLPFVVLPGVNIPWMAIAAVLLVLSEMAGILAVAIGGQRRYDGPFGKSDRAILLSAAGIWIGAFGSLPPFAAFLFAPVFCALLLLTTALRIRGGLLAASSKQPAHREESAPAETPSWAERSIATALGAFARRVTSLRVLHSAASLETSAKLPRIFVANHTSHADFLLLWAALPAAFRRRARPVGAMDYWARGPVRRYLALRVFRAVLVDREMIDRTQSPLLPMIEALQAGDSLVFFPEGTRGNGDSLGRFRCGVYHLLCAVPDVILVPVWIDNLNRVLPRGALLPLPLPCKVAFGAPLEREGDEPKQSYLDRVRATVLELGATCR